MSKKYLWIIISSLIAICFIFSIWFVLNLYVHPSSGSERINTILAVASTISTLFAALSAIVAFSTVSEMRKEHREQNAPFVYIDCPVNKDHGVNLQIQNLGKGVAKDIRIEFEPSPITYNGERLADYLAFKNPIPLLGPNREWRFYIDTILSIIDDKNSTDQDKCPKAFTVSAKYKDDSGHIYSNVYPIDFRSWENRSFVVSTSEESLDQIAKEMEQIRLDKITKTMSAQVFSSISRKP